MNERIEKLGEQADLLGECTPTKIPGRYVGYITEEQILKFAELILANADELKRMMNTDPINKPFELNPKFVAKCDEIGRSRRQFQ